MHILKYYCHKEKKSLKNPKKFKFGLTLLLSGFLMFLILADGIIRDIMSGYPMSVSNGIINEIMDKAMDDVLTKCSVDPNTIDKVVYDKNGNVLSVETNTKELIKVKTEFMKTFRSEMQKHGNNIKISVPIGTLIGNEYTIGRGPKITFNLQFDCIISTELKSTFIDAGVNNTLHTLELYVTANIYVIIPWGHNSKTINTKYILAETAIVGDVPDAFTNISGADSQITDDIVDHGAEIK